MTRSGFCALILQHDVVEVARRRRMRDGFQHLEAALGQLRVAGAWRGRSRTAESSCTIITVLAGLPACVVDGDEVVDRGLGDDAEARAEAERVLQAAADDAVGHADVDDIGQVVARRGLAGGEADRRWHSRRRSAATPARSSSRPRRCRPPASIARRRAPPRSWRRRAP